MTDIEKLLYEYSDTQRRIRELELQIEELQAKKEAIYDKLLRPKPPRSDHVAGGPDFDPVVEAVAKLVDTYAERIRKLTMDMVEANAKLAKIEALVNQAELSEIELRYVRLRYYERRSTTAVAYSLHQSEASCRRVRQRMLEKLIGFDRFLGVG